MGVESTLPICPPEGPIWAYVGDLQPGCPWGLLWLLEECPGLKAIIFLFPECSVCLRERSKGQGRGKKVDPCGNASVCLSATASLCPSVFLPISVCLDLLFSVSQCLYPRLSLLCLCVSQCLPQSLYLGPSVSVLLVSVVLLSLSFLSSTPFPLPPSFLACSSPLPFPSPVPLKLFENRPHRHCYYSVCHPEFVLRNCPLLERIKEVNGRPASQQVVTAGPDAWAGSCPMASALWQWVRWCWCTVQSEPLCPVIARQFLRSLTACLPCASLWQEGCLGKCPDPTCRLSPHLQN